MRRVAEKNDERGAVAVMVAILLVVLLGFAALAIDVGLLYAEKAQLRNGADAAAIGIAQSCAEDVSDANAECSNDVTSTSLAKRLVDANALDSQSNADKVDLNKDARTVSVTTGALQSGEEPNRVSLFFAQALGIGDAEVSVTSHAAWGSPIAGISPFPITFSLCQVRGHVDGGVQLLQSHGSNANPDCNYGPSGSAVPGGFGWLEQQAGKCEAVISSNVLDSRPGTSAPSGCDDVLNGWAAEINAGRSPVVILPVFEGVDGNGNFATFDFWTFAAYEVHGWKFTGTDTLPLTFRNTATHVGTSAACTSNCRGIIGEFITYVSLTSDGYTLGPTNPEGARIVKLTLGESS